jgi:hypothetical protein
VGKATIRVERSLTELAGGGFLFGPPKSAAGRRVVVVPAVIGPALANHVATFTASLPDSLVFTSPTGALLRDGNFRRRVWRPALVEAGLSGIHFHDLRHTGNTLTATTGPSLRELMDRMGHSSPRAALMARPFASWAAPQPSRKPLVQPVEHQRVELARQLLVQEIAARQDVNFIRFAAGKRSFQPRRRFGRLDGKPGRSTLPQVILHDGGARYSPSPSTIPIMHPVMT